MNKSAVIRVSAVFRIEMAHALYGYSGPCRNIHGHSYRLEVTVKGTPKEDGFVIDFTELQALVDRAVIREFDHALAVNEKEGRDLGDVLHSSGFRVMTLPFQPTCENLVLHFASRIGALLPVGVKVSRLRLHETESFFAEWEEGDL